MNCSHKDTNIKPILIFPAGMSRSLEYLKKCNSEEVPVLGSSSLAYDVSKEEYSLWCYLPYITDPAFNEALSVAILEFNVGGIYTPNFAVWNYLNRTLKDINLNVTLVNDWPVNDELSGYRAAIVNAKQVLEHPLSIASKLHANSPVSQLEIATLFRHGNVIPGMCDNEKLNALCDIIRYSPQGDVVEIGSWWGKSAFILARLAHCYDIGKTLCVDPWSSDYLVQNDKGGLLDRDIAQYNCDEILLVFEMNLLPYNANNINYLRMPSTDAAKYYREHRTVTTEPFGVTDYCGHIAILHIDGNHSYDAAKADVLSWCDLVVKGGWIIIDDYIWPYGNGPQRAGDEFLAEHGNKIDTAFVMGSALFIQLSLD